MRIDQPLCNFKNCRYSFDGNCTAREGKRERCEFRLFDEAERDGRVVVLPCKVGSDVWLVLPDYTECSAHGEKYSEYSCAGCESECDSKQTQTIKRHKNVSLLSLGGWIASKCFGKTVFLTREAAEVALKGASHD